MSQARSLDSLSSEWPWPVYSPKNLLNGNEANSLDEWSRSGSAASLDSASHVRWGEAARESTNNSYCQQMNDYHIISFISVSYHLLYIVIWNFLTIYERAKFGRVWQWKYNDSVNLYFHSHPCFWRLICTYQVENRLERTHYYVC